MADEDGILKEMMRLGKFLAQICLAIGHDDAGDGCCARCGAVGSVCKEREQKMQQMHHEIIKLQRELEYLQQRLNPPTKPGRWPGDDYGGYRQSDKSDQWQNTYEKQIYLGASPKPGDIKY